MAARRRAAKQQSRGTASSGVAPGKVEEVEELSSPPTPIIYEVVRRLGEEEMSRPAVSLWWSGVAAGISISFSLLAQAILQTKLPDTPWRHLIVSFGYCIGFLMAVLARQQLFTESTITAVLPVLADFRWRNIWAMARLWGVVLIANMVGTLFAAAFCSFTPVLSSDLLHGMLDISRALLDVTWPEMFFRAIGAGFLMVAMVWLMPSAESAQFHVVTLMTWLIAAGGFTHIVAGSMEAHMLTIAGDWSWWRMDSDFIVPVLLGNVVGGTALFALISYAQVMKEIGESA